MVVFDCEKEADSRQKILIVDDVPISIKILQESLKDEYDICVVTSGKDALQLVAGDNRPDLILLDIIMPEMDGYETCARLKSNPHTANTPIIFLTVMDADEDEEKGLALGAVDYVTKPVSIPILKARVRTHLALKQVEDELRRYQDHLEDLVYKRTHELTNANRRLEDEIGERIRAEQEIKKYRDNLELLVRERTNELAAANARLESEIAERKQAEKDREQLIGELQDALGRVKILSGFLPICASCKKIRDDKGYWNQIEAFICEHSDAEFSHSICPDCVKKIYPDVYDKKRAKVIKE